MNIDDSLKEYRDWVKNNFIGGLIMIFVGLTCYAAKEIYEKCFGPANIVVLLGIFSAGLFSVYKLTSKILGENKYDARYFKLLCIVLATAIPPFLIWLWVMKLGIFER